MPDWNSETITEETTTSFESNVGWLHLVGIIAVGVAAGILVAVLVLTLVLDSVKVVS